MDPAVDPFHPLLRLVDRYRREVNALAPGASEDAIRAAERHLGHRLPLTLAGFLRRWNGGSLFRGALMLRGTSELASPGDDLPGLVAYADLPSRVGGPPRQWAYAPDGRGGFLFGELVDGRLYPLHDRFDRWLKSTIRLFDEDCWTWDAELQVRLDCDPEGGHLLLSLAEQSLSQGQHQRAERLLRSAVAADPGLIPAWQRLGELQLAEGDRGQGRFSLLKALRATRLPRPYPGARCFDPEGLQTLDRLFKPGDTAWQEELESLLQERVHDVRGPDGSALYQAAALLLAEDLERSGGRRAARELLVQCMERARGFALRQPMPDLVVALAQVEAALGLHDDAERHLRPLLHGESAALRARANLVLGRIAVARQEPWAEEILLDARANLEDPADRAWASVLLGERLLLQQRLDAAQARFHEADPIAVAQGDRALQAAVCLGLADVQRLAGDLDGAAVALRAAKGHAESARDMELQLRVELREGTLAEAQGDRAHALAVYAGVAARYRVHELPVREAWALLRVARLAAPEDAAEALRIAREIFQDPGIGLAGGVGACDAIAGQPGASLGWHLRWSAEHARARHEAQRARPPLTRADADRPERRLGSHRIAIAAADRGVVEHLSQQLGALQRELEGAAARTSGEPAVAAYIAAVDLLAYHRSYEAAQVLLQHLLERQLPDLPARALRSAVTRSPNAVLVDGLLAAIETPADPLGVAAAAEILGWRRERAAVPALRRLLQASRSRNVRQAAVCALGRIGDRDAVDDLIDVLEIPELAEGVAVALLLLGDRRGVDFHGQALASGLDLQNPPGEIVGRYGGPSYLLLLMGTAAGDGRRALAALQGLGYLGDPRGVPRLLSAVGRRDRAVVAVACGALELLTGHREEPDEPGVHARWERWWEENHGRFEDGVRYRYGELYGLELLAQTLAHGDALVRRGAYDELVVASGCHLPFDADGPYRLQVAHQRAWREWARGEGRRTRPGTWLFDGQPIG
jgi:HEAT repeat protein